MDWLDQRSPTTKPEISDAYVSLETHAYLDTFAILVAILYAAILEGDALPIGFAHLEFKAGWMTSRIDGWRGRSQRGRKHGDVGRRQWVF